MAMFGNNAREQVKEATVVSSSETRIGKGAHFKGDLELVGNLRLDGMIEGRISSKSRVVLGESAQLKGNLNAQNAEISGEVEGTIQVLETLTLKANAKVRGDISCAKFIVEPGAKIDGKLDMSVSPREIKFSLGQPGKEEEPKVNTKAASPKNEDIEKKGSGTKQGA